VAAAFKRNASIERCPATENSHGARRVRSHGHQSGCFVLFRRAPFNKVTRSSTADRSQLRCSLCLSEFKLAHTDDEVLCVPKSESSGKNHWCMRKTPVPISVSKVQARFRDLVVPRQINLTSGRRAKRLHQYPACGGRGSGDETILNCGFSGHGFRRFVHLDPPRLTVLED
jgi:hypothetical protein